MHDVIIQSSLYYKALPNNFAGFPSGINQQIIANKKSNNQLVFCQYKGVVLAYSQPVLRLPWEHASSKPGWVIARLTTFHYVRGMPSSSYLTAGSAYPKML